MNDLGMVYIFLVSPGPSWLAEGKGLWTIALTLVEGLIHHACVLRNVALDIPHLVAVCP